MKPPDKLTALLWSWVQIGEWRWQVVDQFKVPEFLERLKCPAEFFASPSELLQPKAPHKSSELVRAPLAFGHFPGLIIKRYRPEKLLSRVKTLFRISPARQAFHRALLLQQLRIPTAAPLAAGQRRWIDRLSESYLICAEVAQARSLRDYYLGLSEGGLKPTIHALAQTISQLHNHGIAHTDLHLGNFLIRDRGTRGSWERGASGASTPEIVLIDLDALRPMRRFTQRQAIRDLRRFLQRARVRHSERLCFLVAYCRARSPQLCPRALSQTLGPAPVGKTIPTGPRTPSEGGKSTARSVQPRGK